MKKPHDKFDKRFRYLITILLLCFQLCINAQNKDTNETLKINVVSAAFGGINVAYERMLKNRTTIQIFGSYQHELADEKINAITGGAGLRLYMKSNDPYPMEGLYLDATTDIWRAGEGNERDTWVRLGTKIGHQWTHKGSWVVDIGAGLKFYVDHKKKSNSTGNCGYFCFDYPPPPPFILFPSFTTSVGYQF